jgi:DICT domain-containing protein
MSLALKRAEHYRDFAKRYVRLAAISSSTEKNRKHYLRIAQRYNALAEAEELMTLVHVNSD